MTLEQTSRRRWRALGSAALAAALAASVPAFVTPSWADDAAKADEKVEKKADKAADAKAGDKDEQLADTKVPGKPAIALSDAVRTELGAIRDAYRGLESARLAGTITSDLEIAGEKKSDKGSFESTFQAPTKFRHAVKDGKGGDAAKEDLVVGSTGQQLYVFDPGRKQYLMTEAPKAKSSGEKLGKPYSQLLERQNPALLLALAADPQAEILDGAKSVEKVDDIKVGETAYTALKLSGEKGGEMTLLIDPKTHLIRQVRYDMKSALDPKGQADVKKAEMTIDYADVKAGAEVKAEQFAWAPPEGAKDIAAAVANAGGDDGDGPGGGPGAALEGKPAPDFALKTLDGKDVSLADLKGKVVMLDFWATWCGPCRVSMPHLDKIYNANKDKAFVAYAVNLREDKDDVKDFVDKTKLAMPVLMDTTGKTAEKFAVRGIPQTVVIGKDGTVKKVVVGSGTHETVEKAIEEALKADAK